MLGSNLTEIWKSRDEADVADSDKTGGGQEQRLGRPDLYHFDFLYSRIYHGCYFFDYVLGELNNKYSSCINIMNRGHRDQSLPVELIQ